MGRWSVSLGMLIGLLALALLSPFGVGNIPGAIPAGAAEANVIPADEIIYVRYSEEHPSTPGSERRTGTVAIRAADGTVLGRVPDTQGMYRSIFIGRDGRVFGFERPGDRMEDRFVEFDPSLRSVRHVLYQRGPRESSFRPLVPEFSGSPLVGDHFHLQTWKGSHPYLIVLDAGSGEVLHEVDMGQAGLGDFAPELVPRRDKRNDEESSLLMWHSDWEARRSVYVEIDVATGRVQRRATVDFPKNQDCSVYPLLHTLRDGRVWEEVFCIGTLTLPDGYENIDRTADYLRQLDLRTGRVIREVDVNVKCGDGSYFSCEWDQTLDLRPGGRYLYRAGLERRGGRAHLLRVDLDNGEKKVRTSPLPFAPTDGSALGKTLRRIAASLFPSHEALASGWGPPWSREEIISPDGRLLVTSYEYAYEPGGVLVFDTRTQALLTSILPGEMVGRRSNYVFSPDGRRLYVLQGVRRLLVTDIATGRVLKEMSIPQDIYPWSIAAIGRAAR